MAASQEFTEYILHQLSQSGDIRSRKMFGGVGIYLDNVFCAIIGSSNTFYLRVGDSNIDMFKQAGMRRFPSSKGAGMPYYEVPDSVTEDMDELTRWAQAATQAAILAKK